MNIIKKIISLIVIILISLIICNVSKVEAASFTITSGISSTTVGNSYNISISAKGLTGKFNITHSSNVSVNLSSIFVDNGNAEGTIKVTTKSAGQATVTISPVDVVDSNTGDAVSLSAKTDTVTVKAKSTTSSSSSNSSSKNNSTSNSTNKTTTTSAPSFSSVKETVYAISSVNVRSSYSTSSSIIGSLEKGDSVTRTGKSSSWSRVTYNGQTAYISSQYLTTEKPEKSSNKDLKELEVEGDYKITPEFSKDVTEYDLTVGEDVESIKINAVTEDENAKVTIKGNDKLLTGINTVEVKVTAEDGTEKTYKINVTRGKVEPLGLSELKIEGYTLTPEFNADVYEYTVDIPDLSVTRLNINAIANVENATVELTGEDSLTQGENIITILVKSEDGKSTATYQITANIHEPETAAEETQIIAGIENNDLFLYSGIGIGIIIVIIIIIVVVRHNRRKDDDFGTYYGGFDSLNKDNKKEDNNIKDDDKIDYKTNINLDNEKQTSVGKNIETNLYEKDLNRKNLVEENFGTDVNTNKFDDDGLKKRKGKHF